MIIDTQKTLSAEVPFYGVLRNEGIVLACAKDPNKNCDKCILRKCCELVEGEDEQEKK